MGLTAVSLFAGIEGIGLALHRAGVKVTAAVEIDPAARGVIADHFPDTALLDDVTKVSADDLRATGFDPDRGIVAAGWPCQGNSVAGRRGGMADARSGLWVHVARLLAELRPRWFLGENVPGLLSVNAGRDFAAVIGDLAGLGYGYCWRVLDAQHFGVPQRRRRVFIVGRAGDRAAPVQVLLEPEGGGGDPAAGRAAGTRVAGALMAGSDGRGWRIGADEAAAEQLVVETLRSHPRPGSNSNGALVALHENQRGEITTPDIVGALNTGGGKPGQGYPAVVYQDSQYGVGEYDTAGSLRADPGGTGQGHNTNYVTAVVPALTSAMGNGGHTGHSNKDDHVLAVTHAVTSKWSKGTGGLAGDEAQNLISWQGGSAQDQVLSPDAVSPTLAHSSNAHNGHHQPKVIDATAVRRLTPLECERLQGFPDHWTATSNGKPQSDSARYRQLGNAVAVPCVEWIAKRIAAADREQVAP